MVVAASVKAAGSFVLPKGIMQFSDNLTVTAPTEGLTTDEDFANKRRSLPGIFVSSEGWVSCADYMAKNPEGCEYYLRIGSQYVHLYRIPEYIVGLDFADKEIKPSLFSGPWSQHKWFRDNISRLVEMLPRPSEKHAGLLSYYQTPEKRARDIRTPIKPGRWLAKYFSDILSETEIHELALEWSTKTAIPEVTITQDADEIEEVYVNGPHSCMAHQTSHFTSHIHPTRVYAGPDLAIAYLGDSDDATARAVVWPEKKIWSRLYGDPTRLAATLAAKGYREGEDHEFDGARLQRIPHIGRFVVPYLDHCGFVRDAGDFLIISEDSDDIVAQNTDGLSGSDERSTCYHCEERLGEDDEYHIECEGIVVCSDCCSARYFYCEGYNEYRPDDQLGSVVEDVIESYCENYLQGSSKWFFCEHSEKYYPRDRYEAVGTYQDETVALAVAEAEGFYCEYVEAWVLDSVKRGNLSNGKYINLEQFHSEVQLSEWLAERDLTLIQQEPLPLFELQVA